ncbi:hypothetical protein OKW49_005968 [Paraburkholderia youngii]
MEATGNSLTLGVLGLLGDTMVHLMPRRKRPVSSAHGFTLEGIAGGHFLSAGSFAPVLRRCPLSLRSWVGFKSRRRRFSLRSRIGCVPRRHLRTPLGVVRCPQSGIVLAAFRSGRAGYSTAHDALPATHVVSVLSVLIAHGGESLVAPRPGFCCKLILCGLHGRYWLVLEDVEVVGTALRRCFAARWASARHWRHAPLPAVLNSAGPWVGQCHRKVFCPAVRAAARAFAFCPGLARVAG